LFLIFWLNLLNLKKFFYQFLLFYTQIRLTLCNSSVLFLFIVF
jgi:hypothetical protein